MYVLILLTFLGWEMTLDAEYLGIEGLSACEAEIDYWKTRFPTAINVECILANPYKELGEA